MSTRLDRFRGNKNEFFRTDEHSPLQPDQQRAFTKLNYFPENDDLVFQVRLDENSVSHDPVMLETTSGTQQQFIPAGRIAFDIDGETVHLTLYRESGRGRYFLPFKDATSGHESYAGGRYLDPQETPDGVLTVDFNYAYNPYCAYSEDWTCPIPPKENELDVPIRAGEMAFALDERVHS